MNTISRRWLAAGAVSTFLLPAVAWASTGGGGWCAGLCELLGLGCC